MRILIACEESGTVRDAFLRRGYDAVSCDLLPTRSPGPHYQGDVRDVLDYPWDLMIAHPPCTHLSVSGARHLAEKRMWSAAPALPSRSYSDAKSSRARCSRSTMSSSFIRYAPHPGAYPVFRALCPESGVLLGVCNGYASIFGQYYLLELMQIKSVTRSTFPVAARPRCGGRRCRSIWARARCQ